MAITGVRKSNVMIFILFTLGVNKMLKNFLPAKKTFK